MLPGDRVSSHQQGEEQGDHHSPPGAGSWGQLDPSCGNWAAAGRVSHHLPSSSLSHLANYTASTGCLYSIYSTGCLYSIYSTGCLYSIYSTGSHYLTSLMTSPHCEQSPGGGCIFTEIHNTPDSSAAHHVSSPRHVARVTNLISPRFCHCRAVRREAPRDPSLELFTTAPDCIPWWFCSSGDQIYHLS